MKVHEPKTTKQSKFSFLTSIWIVPIMALFISLWLAYQYFSKLGPQITISFKNNSGLTANQSYIKYRDVAIGVVKEISLDKDGEGVVVLARINKEAEHFLNDTTKFWIVKPEVGTSGITGLDTLISGTYIQMYVENQKSDIIKKDFIGLEKPFIDRNDDSGYRYHLSAPDSRNLHPGSPVYYRKIRVGEIEEVALSKDGRKVDFTIFIKHPYTNYISKDTMFWLMSNISFNFNHSGFNLDLAPMTHILNGGITFDTPAKIVHQPQQGISCIFYLYKDKLAMQKKRIGFGKTHQYHYFLLVDEPIVKLDVGAPVEFFGFQVGSIIAMNSHFDTKMKKIISTIEVVIDTSAFADQNDNITKNTKKFFTKAVEKGLRARIAQSDPITGSQYIELVYEGQEGQRQITKLGNKEIIPSISNNDMDIAKKASEILDKINALDINGLLATVQTAISTNSKQSVKLLRESTSMVRNFRKISSDPALKRLPSDISLSIQRLNTSLDGLNALLQGNGDKSALSQELTITLKELTKASRAIEVLTKKLNKKPNSLIFGDK